ncbi:uncharacterized protein F4822DRAFT_234335 [Hypoxylon trugodes]|uniref:uncharacterized protein n=1 Tax=Hypoxylon trugodes TaxID=326681 RepID=UPI00219D1313|nr:uncharacterized protein F4822DRAFT_234335 [Hypoxylon trugodes]KAI1390373.1 hypothetical protein F4822DRAFT_234335 [Hypoxylon trugodes]
MARRSYAGSFVDRGGPIYTPPAGESLLDFIAWEELDEPSVGGRSNAVESENASPAEPQPTNTGRLKLKNLPNLYNIVDWIMGRNLASQEYEPTKCCVGKDKGKVRDEYDEYPYPSEHRIVEDDFVDIGDVRDICPACATPYCQAVESLPFKSSLRLGYNDPETHTWLIGDKYIMTETVDEVGPNESDATFTASARVAQRMSEAPVPKVIAGWKENGKAITITEKAPGRRLYDIWWELRDKDKHRIAVEVARYVQGWRLLAATGIKNPHDGPVRRCKNLFGMLGKEVGPFDSDDEFWDAIHRRLRSRNVDENVIRTLKDYMPDSAPCLFTHGDLSTANIMIDNGRVSAFLGFETAAYLPVWAEYVSVHFCCCKEDEQWKAILSTYLESYPRAKDWWALWSAVDTKAPNKKRVATLLARCRRWQKPPREKRPYDPAASDYERIQSPVSQLAISRPPPQVQSSHANSLPFRTGSDPSRTSLGMRYLDGREYSGSLDDPHWQVAIHSPTGRVGMETESREGDFLRLTEEQLRAQGVNIGEYWRAQAEITADYRAQDRARRVNIEKWLTESVRGRNAMRPLLLAKRTGEGEKPTQAKEPPWRERQRSFERRGNESRGLRPFSLPLSHVSETIKKDLREVDASDDKDKSVRGESEDGEGSREQSIEKALRALESGRDDAAAATNTTLPQQSQSGGEGRSPPLERKRTSIFRERNRPGSLYLALSNTAAEGRNRRYRDSQSEERVLMVEDNEETY